MFKVNPLAHQPITPLSSSPPPPLQQHHSNDDQHTILPCSNNNNNSDNNNCNDNRATTTAGTCANGGCIMHKIDPECMNRIEHKFTQYYCQVIENDERKTFHHHLPQLLSTAAVASANNNAMIEKMKKYKNWIVVRQFVVQCVRMIRRLILPVLSCSTPIVIYVLYATIAAQRQNQRSNFPERIRHYLRSIIARMRKRIMASKRRILQPTPTPTSTPTLTIVHHFNLIEMLIAISILVTFSSLTSSLYHQKLYSSRVQFTKIQLHLANQALLLLHAETGVHPLHVPRALLEGEQQVELKDAWSHDFIYVPFIDLDQLTTAATKAASTTVTAAKNLKSGSQSSGSSRSSSTAAAMEVVADLIAIHGHAPEILYMASRSEFFFAEGPKGVIFGEEVSDQNKRYILSVVKKMREGTRLKSVIQQQHQQHQQQPSSQSTLEES